MGRKVFKKIFNDNNTFFNYKHNCLMEYINNDCEQILLKSKEYKKTRKRLEEIKEKYSKVRNLLEEYRIKENITEGDEAIIKEAMNLQEKMHILEKKAIFRLGEKEAINFFLDVKIGKNDRNNS